MPSGTDFAGRWHNSSARGSVYLLLAGAHCPAIPLKFLLSSIPNPSPSAGNFPAAAATVEALPPAASRSAVRAPEHRAVFRFVLGALFLFALVLCVYRPILPGSFLMDDRRLVQAENPLATGALTPW